MATKDRKKLLRDDVGGFMRALIRFAWEDLSVFPTPGHAVKEILGTTWLVPEYPVRLPGEMLIVEPLAPKTMARLRRLQVELRGDLDRLATEERGGLFLLQELGAKIEARVPRLRFVQLIEHCGFSPEPTAPLERILYYGLGLAISRGALVRLAKCSHCGRPVMRKLDRKETSGRAFCDDDCRTAFHNESKTREQRALEQRIVRAKRPR